MHNHKHLRRERIIELVAKQRIHGVKVRDHLKKKKNEGWDKGERSQHIKNWNHWGQMTFTTSLGNATKRDLGPCRLKNRWEMKKWEEQVKISFSKIFLMPIKWNCAGVGEECDGTKETPTRCPAQSSLVPCVAYSSHFTSKLCFSIFSHIILYRALNTVSDVFLLLGLFESSGFTSGSIS